MRIVRWLLLELLSAVAEGVVTTPGFLIFTSGIGAFTNTLIYFLTKGRLLPGRWVALLTGFVVGVGCVLVIRAVFRYWHAREFDYRLGYLVLCLWIPASCLLGLWSALLVIRLLYAT